MALELYIKQCSKNLKQIINEKIRIEYKNKFMKIQSLRNRINKKVILLCVLELLVEP